MKKNRVFSASRRMRSNQQRRIMLKRSHQKVLQRHKQFQLIELAEQWDNHC